MVFLLDTADHKAFVGLLQKLRNLLLFCYYHLWFLNLWGCLINRSLIWNAVKISMCCIWKDTFIICYHNSWNFWLLFHSVGNFTFWNMSVCIKVIRTLHKSFKKLVFWSILELENRIGVTWFLSVLLLGYRVGTTSDGDYSARYTIPGKSVHSLL